MKLLNHRKKKQLIWWCIQNVTSSAAFVHGGVLGNGVDFDVSVQNPFEETDNYES